MAAQPIEVPVGDAGLVGVMTLPPRAAGMVAFPHGSGSGQRSPPNRAVADVLARAAIGTLLVGPLTEAEEPEDLVMGRLHIELLADRVISAIDWLASEWVTGDLHRADALDRRGAGYRGRAPQPSGAGAARGRVTRRGPTGRDSRLRGARCARTRGRAGARLVPAAFPRREFALIRPQGVRIDQLSGVQGATHLSGQLGEDVLDLALADVVAQDAGDDLGRPLGMAGSVELRPLGKAREERLAVTHLSAVVAGVETLPERSPDDERQLR